MATNAAMKPSTGKDMKSVIAQLENASKGVGPKPPPPQGAKPPIVALKGYHPGLKPTRTEKQDNGESPASQTEDGAKPFKVALKPVAQRQTSEISSGKPPVKFEKPVKANNEEPSEPPSRSSLVSNKTKMFETSQKQPEVGTSGDQTPQTPSSGSSVSSKSKMFETTQKPSEGGTANNQAPQTSSSGSSVSSKSKMFETSQKPSEVASSGSSVNNKTKHFETPQKPTDAGGLNTKPLTTISKSQISPKPIGRQSPMNSETTLKKGNTKTFSGMKATASDIQSEEKTAEDKAEFNRDSSVTGEDAQTTVANRRKAIANSLENKLPLQTPATTSKSSSTSSTLPRATKSGTEASKNGTKTDTIDKQSDEIEQPKVPMRNAQKPEKSSVQSKGSDRTDQTNLPQTTSEQSDQPIIPPRRAQKEPETKAADNKAKSQEPSVSSQNQQIEPKTKNEDTYDHNANKTTGQNLQSLLRNKERPLPNPAGQKQKQYKLLPVPKVKGKPPKKKAKPPNVNLSKYAKYRTPSQSVEDDGELYEDCESIALPSRESSRISEYTEEEEEKMEKLGKEKSKTTNDNYGKMLSITPDEYEDDDEIYQEID